MIETNKRPGYYLVCYGMLTLPAKGARHACPWRHLGPSATAPVAAPILKPLIFLLFTFKTNVYLEKNTEQSNIVVSTAKLFMAHVNVIFYLTFMHEVFPCTLRSSQTDVSLPSFCQLISSHYLSNKRSSNFVTDHGWYAFHVTFKDGLKCSHFQNSCS